MKSEKDKMLNGEYYNPLDTELITARTKARLLLKKYNELKENDTEKKKLILKQLIAGSAPDLVIQAPFFCDYGFNIRTGSGVFFNFNCVLLDVCGITIGDRTIFGPGVHIYNASHPADHLKRASGIEFGIPVTIGDDVWIGGNVTILPGVNIGSRSIIGAGSVVIKDMPPDVMAAGNPCRVIKKLNIEA